MNAMKYGLADESSMAMTPVIRALVPNLQLVLASHDETTDAEYRSNAPDRLDYRIIRSAWDGSKVQQCNIIV